MIAPAPETGICIAIDRGGTFTDCIATVPGQDDIVIKLLSVNPSTYPDAPVEAIRRVLEKATGRSYPRGSKISLDGVKSIKMGTTVATNALLERNGAKTVFMVTEGFKDLLTIGNQSRPKMFDLAINRPESLSSRTIQASERVTLEAWTENKSPMPIDVESDPALTVGSTGEIVRILKPLNVDKARKDLQQAFDDGFQSLSVCLMHSYTYSAHEEIIDRLAREIGFEQISISSKLMPMCKIVPRGHSATADAYLTPEIRKYIEGFESGFEDLANSGCRCEFMQSDGGLVEFRRLSGLRAILSGPAGGVIGYASTCYQEGDNTPVIGFDMGGTSTDVSRYAGELEHIFESTTAGITVQSPQLDINTIAAGGGSILTWRNNMFAVGPESASSHPGPACYRKGGPLTVTDANLLLGRILPESFPKIFGPNEDQGLDVEAARRLFVQMKDRINEDVGTNMTIEEVAAGFLAVANESMCRPIRALTESKGHDTALHNLASFGGAGGQHAASIARILGIKRVLIHKYSSILSAYGMALAEVVHEEQAPSALKYGDDTIPLLLNELGRLEDKATSALMEQGIPLHLIRSERYLNMRYRGSDTSLMIRENASEEQDFTSLFVTSHHKQFGFTPQKASVIVDDVRVRCIGQSGIAKDSSIDDELATLKPSKQTSTVQRQVYFENHGWLSTPCHNLNELPVGAQLPGPALLIDNTQTIIVPPGTGATRLQNMVILDVGVEKKVHPVSLEVDPVQLSIFGHRFMGIAEQMGRALQKTSVSTNIKERLDFSCTVFAPDGSLVANAPHVPAMIGSMAYAVKWQIAHWKGVLKPGDVILTNSPICGGVHLPDLTTITPVFDAEGKDIIFWTASRGHHADVGGILPGSMPPNSRELWEEGAVFEAFKVVDQGVFQEDALTRKFLEPAKYPGSSGTRCLEDNVSDVRAQIAANHRGAQLIQALIRDYGFDTVQLYMREIQSAAELAVRNLLKQISREISATKLNAVDYMDDGTPIKLQITIDAQDGGATFDFTGTGGQVYGNWNAPIAITHSSILFALRCMVGTEIPLNQGAIKPIKVIVPDGSLLKPSPLVAVCAGNVLTSQRIVDVIFLAFDAMAASQGCMNNFCFGSDDADKQFGYYETICGGSGAGPFGHGTSGVHTNMTNTRITDPEILERRYPVILRQFSLRPNSGGNGLYRGGDGVIRDVEFSIPLSVSILSERRSMAPYGLHGGEPGLRGQNTWVHKDGSRVSVGGKCTVKAEAGDRFVINSPGGGGWGAVGDRGLQDPVQQTEKPTMVGNGSIGNSMRGAESN